MKKYITIIILFSMVISISYSLTIAYAIDNNCGISVWTMFELTPILGCIEDRLDALENASNGNDDTLCTNVGSGSQIYKDGECNFRTILGSSDISVTQQTDTITIDFNGTSGGETTECINVGEQTVIIKNSTNGNCFVKSLVAGIGISITNGTDTITISSTIVDTDKQIGQVVAQTYLSLVKTNIGIGYSNVYYNTAFDEEHLSSISFTNATYFKIIWIWDYEGIGNQQCKWIDGSGNILYETTVFALDRDGIDSGWLPIPAGMNEPSLIRWQCKSTVAGDDPIAKGYKIMIK